MKIEFLRSKDKKQVLKELDKIYGIKSLPYLLIKSGKEKVRIYSGGLSREEINLLSRLAPIESIGLYIVKKGEGYRLSFDATQLFKSEIKKSVFDMDEETFYSWIQGADVEIKAPRGILVMSYKGDFIGCGKSNGEKIFNQIPKERRVKL